MIPAAAHIESLGEMKWEHGLTISAFIQLYVKEHMFNIECKHGRNITVFLPLWDNKVNTVRSTKYPRSNGTKCPFVFVVEKKCKGHSPYNLRFLIS